MTIPLQIEIAKAILKTDLVSKVFYNCQLIKAETGQNMYPAYQRGEDFVFLGPDDTKGMFAYIRINGPVPMTKLKVASCSHNYTFDAPLRVVFFNDNETRDHQFLILRLASFGFLGHTTIQRITEDKYVLMREESDLMRQSFDAKTFYVAFDITVNDLLLQSQCEAVEPCDIVTNPLCKS